MKTEWVEKSLDQICTISHGFAFKGSDFKKDNDKSKPIVITPGNFTEEATLNFSHKNTKRYSGNEPEGVRFNVGELVVVMTDLSSKMKILGKPAFVEQDNILHNQRIGRVVIDEDELVPRYLYYFFRTSKFLDEVKLTATGTMVKHTAPKRILSHSILVPPLSEQEEIVEVLDKAFAAIDQAKANIEQNIANAKELFQSKLNQIFSQKGEGWVETSLETVCGFQNGFAFKSSKFRDEGIPILRISNIQNDQIDLRKIVYTKPEDYQENLERYKIVKGDLMIAMSGATTGKIGINKTDTEYLLNQRVGKFSPSDDLSKRFLYYFLLTKAEENLRISAGAAQPNLSTSQIKSFQIPLPSLELQEDAVLMLDAIQAQSRALESHYQTKLASLDELKKSILQKAFAGELT